MEKFEFHVKGTRWIHGTLYSDKDKKTRTVWLTKRQSEQLMPPHDDAIELPNSKDAEAEKVDESAKFNGNKRARNKPTK